MNGVKLTKQAQEWDIGVLITSDLKPTAQCEKAANSASSVLGQILSTFTYRDREVLPKVFRTYVRPHLEFAVPAWAPWEKV